jgi:hypothetical protein
VGRSEEKKLLGGPRCGWEGIIKIDLKELGWENMDWIYLARYRWKVVAGMVMKLWVP